MSFFRYVADVWSFGMRAAALSSRIEEGTLTPTDQAKAVRELLVSDNLQTNFKNADYGMVAA